LMIAILGYTDLLLDGDREELSAASRGEYLSTIQRNGRHLMLIINDILDLSKIESGGMTLEAIPCDVREISAGVLDLLRPQAQVRRLGLNLNFGPKVPAAVVADPTRIRQILLNLVGNALKFTEAGGVDVEVFADRMDDAEWLHIAVTDSGIGIPADAQAAVFLPFAQADTSTTRRFGGTGLGLAICQRLAHLMDGELTLESEPGRGSRFTLRIPLRTPPSSEVPVPHGREITRPTSERTPLSARVLLAEDGPDNQMLISHILRRAGAEVEIAENGHVAVERLTAGTREGKPFDLLVMDIQMPVMDGISAIRKIRTLGIEIPALALTAHAMAEERSRCLAAGFNDFASKPIDRASLLAACRQLATPPPQAIDRS